MTIRPSSSRRNDSGSGSRGRDVRVAPPFEPTPILSLAGPAELIDSVPYLLGFHPCDSLVLVGLGSAPDGRDRVGVSARVDLADLVVDPGIVRRCTAALARSGAQSAVVLIYDSEAMGAASDLQPFGDAPSGMPWRAVIDEVGEALEDAQLSVRDALLVGDDLWWSYLCSDPACCPPDGSPRSGPGSRTAATATYAGLSALPDREALEGVLAPHGPDALALMLPLLKAAEAAEFDAIVTDRQASHRRSVIRALFAAARADALDEHGGDGSRGRTRHLRSSDDVPSPEQIARFGVALGDISVRDACWLAMEGGRIPPSGLWRTLAQGLPTPYDAQPLFLLGWQEWRAGHGTLAGIAADRAIQSNPKCSAARLLLDAIAQALDPRTAPRLRADQVGDDHEDGGEDEGGADGDGDAYGT